MSSLEYGLQRNPGNVFSFLSLDLNPPWPLNRTPKSATSSKKRLISKLYSSLVLSRVSFQDVFRDGKHDFSFFHSLKHTYTLVSSRFFVFFCVSLSTLNFQIQNGLNVVLSSGTSSKFYQKIFVKFE